MFATIVDTHALLKVIAAAFLAGVGVSITFSLVILGVTRSGDQRGRGHGTTAGAYLALAVVALAVFAAGVVYGISVMAKK